MELSVILDQEILLLKALSQSLKNEHQAMREYDSDALATATKEKGCLLPDIEHLEHARKTFLSRAEYSDDESGLLAYARDQVEEETDLLMSQWQEIRHLLKQCQEQNHLNGVIIANGQRQVYDLIQKLFGHKDEDQEFYDAKAKRYHGGKHSKGARA